jgi:hypothetical protein
METLDPPHQNYTPMSVKDWMITILITIIPIVGFVMLFVWAFSEGTHKGKSNWAKATLLWYAILIVLYIVFFAIFGAAFFATQGLENM